MTDSDRSAVDRRGLEHVARGSRLLAAVGTRPSPGGAVTTVRSWIERSTSGRFVGRAQRVGDRIVAGARVVDAAGIVGQWVRSSWLYRWLTAEPEPDVIVIDLRETVTVGPALVALDEAIGLLERGRHTSLVGTTVADVSRRFRDTPIRLVSVGLLVAAVASALVGVVRGIGTAGLRLRAIVAALALAGTRVTVSWETIRESRPVRIAIALLEPPAPPEEIDADRRDRFRDDREE